MHYTIKNINFFLSHLRFFKNNENISLNLVTLKNSSSITVLVSADMSGAPNARSRQMCGSVKYFSTRSACKNRRSRAPIFAHQHKQKIIKLIFLTNCNIFVTFWSFFSIFLKIFQELPNIWMEFFLPPFSLCYIILAMIGKTFCFGFWSVSIFSNNCKNECRSWAKGITSRIESACSTSW